MAESTSRTALLEDPQLRPFLPLLWVAWSDGDMEEADLADLCARPSELKALLDTIERVSAATVPRKNAATTRRTVAVSIPVAMAMKMGGADSPTNVTARSDKLLSPLREESSSRSRSLRAAGLASARA